MTVSVGWPVQFNCQSLYCVPFPVPFVAAVHAAWSSVTMLTFGFVSVEYQTSLDGDRLTEPTKPTTLNGLTLISSVATV